MATFLIGCYSPIVQHTISISSCCQVLVLVIDSTMVHYILVRVFRGAHERGKSRTLLLSPPPLCSLPCSSSPPLLPLDRAVDVYSLCYQHCKTTYFFQKGRLEGSPQTAILLETRRIHHMLLSQCFGSRYTATLFPTFLFEDILLSWRFLLSGFDDDEFLFSLLRGPKHGVRQTLHHLANGVTVKLIWYLQLGHCGRLCSILFFFFPIAIIVSNEEADWMTLFSSNFPFVLSFFPTVPVS